MPVSTSVPRTTHQWLKRLYDYLDKGVQLTVPSGASGIPNAAWLGTSVPITRAGNATGVLGFYGSSGIAQGTALGGTAGITGWSAGFSFRSNGGTGANFYTFDDVVAYLKSRGDLAA